MEALGGGGGEGFGLGTLLAGLASAAFVVFVGYKISKKREELRDTIQLLTNEQTDFVDKLESLVETGKLQPSA